MRIDQSRQDGLALQIDLPRLRAGQAQDRVVSAHGHDPVAADGHRLGEAELIVDRHDLAVVQDDVRGRGGRGGRGEPGQNEDQCPDGVHGGPFSCSVSELPYLLESRL